MVVTNKGQNYIYSLLRQTFFFLQKYDALVVRSATQVTKAVLEAGVNLKVVGRAGAGVDNIDIKVAGERGIGVIK